MQAFKCDKCGKLEVGDSVGFKKFAVKIKKMVVPISIMISQRINDDNKRIDICKECFNSILEEIKEK